MSALSGQIASPGDYNDDIRGRIARARRITDSTATAGTEQPVLQLDGIVLKAGRVYQFSTSTLLTVTTVANDLLGIRFRYSSTGTATIASTELEFTDSKNTATSSQGNVILTRSYSPAADETGSLLLTVVRLSGTGNVQILGAAAYPVEILVDDMGPDPGDTGVSL